MAFVGAALNVTSALSVRGATGATTTLAVRAGTAAGLDGAARSVAGAGVGLKDTSSLARRLVIVGSALAFLASGLAGSLRAKTGSSSAWTWLADRLPNRQAETSQAAGANWKQKGFVRFTLIAPERLHVP
jgi:hypothetical protein